MKILLFGGTTEGREFAESLSALGADVTLSVATPLGAEPLSEGKNLRLVVGRRDVAGLCALLEGHKLCIDATHPYAVEASDNIRIACAKSGVALRRLLRPASATETIQTFPDCQAAAAYLQTCEGNVLLTIGTKALPAFAALDRRRVYARVLPTVEAITLCEEQALPHRQILALQGPFSQKMNEAMLEQYEIRYLVTKDGGAPGGFAEKVAAAQALGVTILLIGRPVEEGETAEALYQSIREVLTCE